MANIQTVTYDGVDFPFAHVTLRGQAIYDQPGNVLQGHTLTFRISSVITGTTVTNFRSNLQDRLEVLALTRRRFFWRYGSTEDIYDINPATAAKGSATSGTKFFDRRFGPKPRVIDIKQITGGLSCRLDFEIETYINLCESANDVEEFWWRFSYAFDSNYNCTRTVRGRYRVRSPLVADNVFVGVAGLWPTIPRGFFRQSQDRTLSQDGLTLDFTTVDKQVWRTLPRPMTDGTATFRIEQRMAQLIKTLTCSFTAPADINKKVIVQFIVALIRGRFPDAVSGSKKEYFTSFQVTNHEFENRVDVTVTSITAAQRLLSSDDNLQLLFMKDIIDVTPEALGQGGDEWLGSDGVSASRGMVGTAGLVAQPSPLFEVCDTTAAPDQGSTGLEGLEDGELTAPGSSDSNAPADSIGADVDDLGQDNDAMSQEHLDQTYISFQETWRFMLDHNIRIVPVAAADVDDIIQQTTNPQMRIMQFGTATRIAEPPKIPQPAPIEDVNARVDIEEQITEAPTTLADGQTLVFKAKWAYTIVSAAARQIVDTIEAGSGQLDKVLVQYPFNPLLSTERNNEIGKQITEHRQAPIEEDGEYEIALNPS